jgi:hypothetical protein
MDYLFIFAQSTNGDGEALIDWINPGVLTAVAYDSPTFTALEGFTGHAGAADSLVIPQLLSDGTNFTVNDAAIGVYIRLDIDDGGYVLYAVDGESDAVYLRPRTGGAYNGSINQNTGLQSASGQTSTGGLYILTRESSTQTRTYRGTTEIDADGDGSSAVPGANLSLLYVSSQQVSINFTMDQCSSADVAGLNAIFLRYMKANGKGL